VFPTSPVQVSVVPVTNVLGFFDLWNFFSVEHFDTEGDRFAAADAEARNSTSAAGAFERIQEGYKHAGPAASDRVPQGNGPSVDVDPFGWNSELAFGDQRDDSKGLV